jgi:hypothetical protein
VSDEDILIVPLIELCLKFATSKIDIFVHSKYTLLFFKPLIIEASLIICGFSSIFHTFIIFSREALFPLNDEGGVIGTGIIPPIMHAQKLTAKSMLFSKDRMA